MQIPPGNARGTAWSGCFSYEGRAFGPTSGAGTSGGSAQFVQQDGALRLVLGWDREFIGGIDRKGQFRVGREQITNDGSILRDRIDEIFETGAQRYRYTHRTTLLDPDGRVRNTTRHIGFGQRRPC